MASINVRVDRVRLDALLANPELGDDAIGAVALEGERIVKTSFNTSPPGRSYKRGSVIHIASMGGYPPNTWTGKLANAINVTKSGPLQRSINTGDTEYALPLEFGTVKMQARPFMRPMAVKLEQEIPRLVDGFLEK